MVVRARDDLGSVMDPTVKPPAKDGIRVEEVRTEAAAFWSGGREQHSEKEAEGPITTHATELSVDRPGFLAK